MPDETTKHGPRLDDELDRDTGTRAEESRRWQGPEDGVPGQRPHRQDVENPAGLEEREAETRSDLARYLVPKTFPAERGALVKSALSEHAPDWVIDVLKRLPDDRRFENFEQVWEAAGGRAETRGR